jgi:hypothetical protein
MGDGRNERTIFLGNCKEVRPSGIPTHNSNGSEVSNTPNFVLWSPKCQYVFPILEILNWQLDTREQIEEKYGAIKKYLLLTKAFNVHETYLINTESSL